MANTNPLADAYKKLVPNAPVFPPNGTSTAYPLATPVTPTVKPVTDVPAVSPTTGLATTSTPAKTTQTSTIAPDDPSNKYNTQTGQLNPKYKAPAGSTTGGSTGGPTRPNTMPADTGYTSSLNTGSTATQPTQPSMTNADIMQKFTDLSTQAKTQYGFAIQTSEQEKQNTLANIQAQTGIDTQVLTNGYETAQATLNRAIGLVGMSAGIDKNKVQDLLDQNKSLFESFHSGLTSINANEQNAINNADITQAKAFDDQGKQMTDFVSNLFTQQVAVVQKQQSDAQGLLTNMVNTGALGQTDKDGNPTVSNDTLIDLSNKSGIDVYTLADLRKSAIESNNLSVKAQWADILQKVQATKTSASQQNYYDKQADYKGAQTKKLGDTGTGTSISTIDDSNLEQVKQAIAGAESGGDYSAIGPLTASGEHALGKYEMMPENLKLVGLTDSPEDQQKYLNDPQTQDKAYDTLMNQLITQYNGDARKVVAAYYGGPKGAEVVDTPAGNATQVGGQSINEYVNKVLGDPWNVNDASQPPAGNAGNVPVGGTGRTANYIWQQAINLALDKSLTPQKLLGGLSGASGTGKRLKDAVTNKSAALISASGVDQYAMQQEYAANGKALNTQVGYLNTVQRALSGAEAGATKTQELFANKNIDLNDSTWANMTINDLTKKFGDSGDIRAYQAAMVEIGNEYSQVFARGGQRSVEGNKIAQDIVNGNVKLADIQKSFDTLQEIGNTVVNTTIGQVKSITQGGGTEEVAKFLAYIHQENVSSGYSESSPSTATTATTADASGINFFEGNLY